MSELGNKLTETLTEHAHNWVMQEDIPAEAVFSALSSTAVNVAVAAVGPQMAHAWLIELLRQFEADFASKPHAIN
jgi:hypothetical protein